MQTLETDSAVIPFPATEEAAPTAQGSKGGNYDAVRYNALRHGILSRYTVLPHEDADEYRALLLALVEEYQPAGATEAHLVEELGGIIWRKRRVLQAEGAAINRGLLSVATQRHDRPLDTPGPAQAAVPFEPYMKESTLGHPVELAEAMRATAKEVAERQREAQHDLQGTEKAAAILRKGGANAYERALRALSPGTRV